VFWSLALAATLVASPQALTLHPSAESSLTIAGAQGPIAASSSGGLVSAVPDPEQPGTFDITAGPRAGTDTLHVTDAGGSAVDVPVRVAQDAGVFPSALAVTVTGWPIDWSWLWTEVRAAVARASTVEPGATITLATPSSAPSPPPPNASTALDIPVTISGGAQYYDATGVTHVTIDNAPVQPVAPPLLLYDDDPERVSANGVVYRAQVDGAQAVRLYYYHDDGGDPRRLVVLLQADRPTVVQAIDASAGPNLDVLSVGHAVSVDALTMTARNEGVVYTLVPGSFTVLHDVLMTQKQGVAGAIGLQVLRGGPATIEVLSLSPGDPIPPAVGGPLLPGDGKHRTGTFDIGNFGAIALAYAVGGPDATYEYGSRNVAPPNVDAASSGSDLGDYGVIQTLLFSLSNPTAGAATVYLYERPLGGIARSSFLVDGEVRQVGCVRDSQQRYLIAAFQLAAGGRYQLSVATMPDGGSNFPLEVGVTATEPLAAAPPISSPDGCFPKPAP
jgi:hypothetical protein